MAVIINNPKPRSSFRSKKNSFYVRTRKYTKNKKINKNFRKKVQKVINENNEDKEAWKSVSDINYNSGINTTTDVNFLVPNITRSTDDNGRIGDQIRATKFNIRGHIITNLTFIDYNSCRIGVRMIICQPKNYGSLSVIQNAAATWTQHLLKKGGTTSGFSGQVNDLYSPINSDAITTYYDKVFYMQTPYVPGTQQGNNITTRITKFFNINLRVKNKKILYDASIDSGLNPVDYNPSLLIGYAHLTNSTPDTADTQINLSWVSSLKFQDS